MVLAQYLLTFREVLEAALLSAIILAFLVRTGRKNLTRYAWYGIYGASAASIGLGVAVWAAYGSLSEANQVLFEGVAALIAVAVLTSMIYWMATKGRSLKTEVEGRVQAAVTQGTILALISLTFVLVFREGLETVLFLTPFLVQDALGTVVGAVVGLGFGLGLAYGIFRVGLKLDLRKFFYVTSILLVLLAGGLLGYGVHELIEYAGIQGVDLGWWGSTAYNLGLSGGDPGAGIAPDPLHHRGYIGSIFAVLFGYTARAEWGRVIAHVAYLIVVLPLVISVYKPGWASSLRARVKAALRPADARTPGPRQG